MYELMECYSDLPELQQKAVLKLIMTICLYQRPLHIDELQEAQDDILNAFNTVHGMWLQQAATKLDPLKTK